MKRLVVCCDGTWNKPDQLSGGVRSPTSVPKLALGVAREDGDGTAQILYYQRGVGTRRGQRLRGGIGGFGLSRNIRDCYRFVVDHYEPGDELFLFGFSRGAYTARSTAGLIRNSGILRPARRDRIDEAYSLYRSRSDRAHPSSIESTMFRRMYSHAESDIHFVGVWDTVGSLGIPIDGLRLPFTDRLWGFHDTQLSSHVRFAYHALSIDERAGPFKPTLWKQQADAGGQVLEQVWFAGDHCDVGGGHANADVAEIPLLWMAQCAAGCGLAFDPGHFVVEPGAPSDERRWMGARVAPDPLGAIHPSPVSIYKVLPPHKREPAAGDGQSVASSVVRRLDALDGYAPPGLDGWVAGGGRVTTVHDG